MTPGKNWGNRFEYFRLEKAFFKQTGSMLSGNRIEAILVVGGDVEGLPAVVEFAIQVWHRQCLEGADIVGERLAAPAERSSHLRDYGVLRNGTTSRKPITAYLSAVVVDTSHYWLAKDEEESHELVSNTPVRVRSH